MVIEAYEAAQFLFTNGVEVTTDGALAEQASLRSAKSTIAIIDNARHQFNNTMLQKADLNILEYRPVVEDRFVPSEYRERIQKENIPEEMKEALLKPTADSVAFVNHSNDGDFDIPLKWQSKGTIKYIRILDALYDMITSSHVYYLDLASAHPESGSPDVSAATGPE